MKGDVIVEKRSEDGGYVRINIDQAFRAIRAKRSKENVNAREYPNIDTHPLFGAEFKRDDDYLKITKVVVHWYAGFYYWGIYEINNSGSHGCTVIDNINSIDPFILECLEEFKQKFILIEKEKKNESKI